MLVKVLEKKSCYRGKGSKEPLLVVIKMSEEGSVSQCLELLGLQEFAPQLMDQGFDRLHDILSLDEDDFAMLIRDEEVKTRYKTALQQGNDM